MNLFKTLVMVGLLGIGVVSKGLCTDSEDADLKRWQEKAASIKSGTPLAEVKKILEINPKARDMTVVSGSHYLSTFQIHSHIIADIDYQTGPAFPNDPINKVTVRYIAKMPFMLHGPKTP